MQGHPHSFEVHIRDRRRSEAVNQRARRVFGLLDMVISLKPARIGWWVGLTTKGFTGDERHWRPTYGLALKRLHRLCKNQCWNSSYEVSDE